MKHTATLFTLLALAATLAGCGDDKPAAPPPRPVLYTEVKTQAQATVGRFAGTIQARYETTLGFRTNGRMASRTVNVGDKVDKGTLLATLDPSDQENQLRASQGEMASAKAQWLDAQANARRQQELFDRGVGAKASLDDAQTQLKTARATLEQRGASVQQAEDQLTYTRLLSDFDGVVTAWHAEIGQVVAAGQEVLTLARPDVREAVFDLPDELAAGLPATARFTVSSQLQSEVSTGASIRELAPQADATTRSRRVRLTLDSTPEALRLGTTVNVQLSNAAPAHSNLPASALIDEPGSGPRRHVWVIVPGTGPEQQVVQRREVQVLGTEGDQVLIGAGLNDGDRVVQAGANSLREGQVVKLDAGAAQ